MRTARDPPSGQIGVLVSGASTGRLIVRRLLVVVLLASGVVTLLLAVPELRPVLTDIGHLNGLWLALAIALELASCFSFVVVFRLFFDRVRELPVRRLAWTEMGSGALLPGGGVGSLAVGAWLLHLAGMPTERIIQRSSGLFFFTSATNVAALLVGGFLLATGISAGPSDLVHADLPILAGLIAIVLVATVPALTRRRRATSRRSSWLAATVSGITEAKHVARRPTWRAFGAIGYLGFDIAVLWSTLSAVGYTPPIAPLILGYTIGYLANVLPVPGSVGVLEGGIAGALILYGAPVTQATAGVLIYHAVAFWIPSAGGLIGYALLRRHLRGAPALAPASSEPAVASAPA
jgi:uncharacterized membrane protein YbhN (UPF0104 family)